MGGAVANTATGAGLTVIVLVTGASVLPHASVAVQVSVIVPPQAPGAAEKVDVADVPVIKHDPLNPLVNGRVDDTGVAPQAIVMAAGAVITGNAAGLMVITCVKMVLLLLQGSLATHVFV